MLLFYIRKMVMINLRKALFKVYVASACQLILFKVFYILYPFLWPSESISWWLGITIDVVFPLVSGCIVCWFVNRKHFRWDMKHVQMRESIYRLCIRMFAVFSLVTIGFVLEALRHANPTLPNDILLKMGMRDDTIWGLMLNYTSDVFVGFFFNLFSDICAAIFPLVFAITEVLFVPFDVLTAKN